MNQKTPTIVGVFFFTKLMKEVCRFFAETDIKILKRQYS